MLRELKVSHFAIIENIHLEFEAGLNILSGETGAGKSILLKSLALLMGTKSSAEMVRSGSDFATIEGLFDLSQRVDIQTRLKNFGINVEEGSLIVRRVISSQGKNRVYLNGSLSTLTDLRETVTPLIEVTGPAAPLIEMTGQFESRHLTSRSFHLDLLDQYIGAWELRNQFQKKYKQMRETEEEIQKLTEDLRDKNQRIDFLQYQCNEIVTLQLKPGDETTLEEQVKKMKNASHFQHLVRQSETLLYTDDDSAMSRIHQILRSAHELLPLDQNLRKPIETLEQAKTFIEEAIFDLRDYQKNMTENSTELEIYEGRLSQLRKLQKKYGTTAEEILKHLSHMEEEVEILQKGDDHLEKLKIELSELTSHLQELAKDLHLRRTEGSGLLTDTVNDELIDLNMKGSQLSIQVEETKDLGPYGISDVEFLIRSSEKDPFRPLGKVASGGELSRILLSLKKVIGNNQWPRTYLFDEVDTGVSGPTAEKVGKKLHSIAQGQQVICITHLPQVASCGDTHFYIHKASNQSRMEMNIEKLSGKKRVQEIARLISGKQISKTSLAHAEELLHLSS